MSEAFPYTDAPSQWVSRQEYERLRCQLTDVLRAIMEKIRSEAPFQFDAEWKKLALDADAALQRSPAAPETGGADERSPSPDPSTPSKSQIKRLAVQSTADRRAPAHTDHGRSWDRTCPACQREPAKISDNKNMNRTDEMQVGSQPVDATPETDAFQVACYGPRTLSPGSRHRTDSEWIDFAKSLERRLRAAEQECEKLAIELHGARPYLKNGETVAECIARNRRDADIVLGQLATETKRAEAADALAAQAARIAELEVYNRNQEAMITGHHKYTGQDFQFRLDRANKRIADLERDLSHANLLERDEQARRVSAEGALAEACKVMDDAEEMLGDAPHRVVCPSDRIIVQATALAEAIRDAGRRTNLLVGMRLLTEDEIDKWRVALVDAQKERSVFPAGSNVLCRMAMVCAIDAARGGNG